MNEPPKLERGPQWLCEIFNALRAYAIAKRPAASLTCDIHETESGTQILPRVVGSAAGGGAERVPLEPYNSSEGGSLKISIRYGTVGAGELDSYGPVTITATRYFFAKVTTNGAGVITARELHDQAGATASGTDTVFYLLLGRAVVSGGAITTVERNLSGSVSFQRCGYAGNYVAHFDHV